MEAHSAFDAEQLLEHADWIRALARRLVRDGDAADELVQETWASALEHRPATNRPLRPWLASVLRNFARERRRSEAHRKLREEAAAVPEALPSPAELAGTVELHKLIVELVLGLAEPYRETVILRTLRGLTSAEIARARGVAAATVRWRLKMGLDALREELDGRFGGDRSAWCAALLTLATASESKASSAPMAPSVSAGMPLMNAIAKLVIGAVAVTAAVVAAVAFVRSDEFLSLGSPLLEATPVEVTYAPLTPADAALADGSGGSTRRALAPSTDADALHTSGALSRPLGSARARVFDEDGLALAGIELSLQHSDLAPARSGPDGVAALAEPDSGWPDSGGTFEFSAPGYARVQRTRELEVGAVVLLGDVELGPGGDVSGRIVDSEGNGLSGAWVGALTDAESVLIAQRFDRTTRYSTAAGILDDSLFEHTDEHGAFLVRGVPAGFARIYAGGRDHLTALSTPLEVRAGEEARGVVLALAPLGPEHFIEGIVLTHAGHPAPNAHVACENPNGGGGSFSVGEDGRFRFLVKRAGPHRFTASDPNDPTCVASVGDVRGGTLDLELVFPDARFFELEARAPDGAAVESYGVEILTVEGSRLADLADELRPDGIARLRVPSASIRLRVLARGFDAAEVGPWAPAEIPARVACTLAPLPGVRGVVVADGEPLAGAEVSLMWVVDQASHTRGFPVRLLPFEPGWPPTLRTLDRTTTDASGEFALSVRDRGMYALLVEAKGFALAEEGPLDVEPRVGVADLVVELGRGGALDVRVHAQPGRDPTGAIVGCSRGDGRERVERVDAGGRVRFESLTPGRWQVELRDEEDAHGGIGQSGRPASDALPWNCEVREGETTEFALWIGGAPSAALDACRLQGTLAIDGTPPGGWRAILAPLEEATSPAALGHWMSQPGALVDPTGRFELEMKAPGPARLVLLFGELEADARMILDRVDLRAGDNAWSCAYRTGALEGFATPSPDALVFCLSEGPGERVVLVPVVPDASGRFSCSGVPAGPCRVAACGAEQRAGFDPRAGRTLAEIHVTAGATTTVDLR